MRPANILEETCRVCPGTEFENVLDMGHQPLVNSLLSKSDEKVELYPLVVERCVKCGHVQIRNHIRSSRIYRDQDYLYYSGDMPNLDSYFGSYADSLKEAFVNEGDFVVEIGSNDGTMLKHFEYPKLGIDPSTNVVIRAIARGIPTISDFFSERVALSITREMGLAKLVYANNCIAHVDNLHDVLRGVDALLRPDGVFVLECNYWGAMVKNLNYALIYHDHFSYFSLRDWFSIAKMYGWHVFDAEVTEAQGGSLRVYITKRMVESTARCSKLIGEEGGRKPLNSSETARKYEDGVRSKANVFGGMIKSLKAEGKTIAGYGAAAKGFSLLSLAGVTDEIEYFVDDSPAKQGKFTPVGRIPVVARTEFKNPDVFVITAPNYKDVILEKEKPFTESGGSFLLEDGTFV